MLVHEFAAFLMNTVSELINVGVYFISCGGRMYRFTRKEAKEQLLFKIFDTKCLVGDKRKKRTTRDLLPFLGNYYTSDLPTTSKHETHGAMLAEVDYSLLVSPIVDGDVA